MNLHGGGIMERRGLATAQQQPPKALRFVTNYGAPHPKRRRIGAACMTCRKRKTACSGERPTCETCKQNKLDCAGYSSESPSVPGYKRTTSDFGGTGSSNTSPRCNETGTNGSHGSFQTVKQEKDKVDPALRSTGNNNGALPATMQWNMSNADTLSPGPATSAGTGRPAPPSDASHADFQRGGDAGSLFSGPRNRMPYFRWLGPTAIMPGFKQMVVKIKRQDTDHIARSSTDGGAAGERISPSLSRLSHQGDARTVTGVFSSTPAAAEPDARTPLNLPFYDTSPIPPSELITHLANTFFTHLGCNYPFLQRERFLRDLEEKQVDAILVDAVCALAARFSTHSLLTSQSNRPAGSHGDEGTKLDKPTPAEYGHAFAQRAHIALVDTFPCPSVAAVQAALLLAYNEFGESRDSGLWMYLGISIRMAQDLGLHKVEGLKYKGRGGPTPKMIKKESNTVSQDALAAVKTTDEEKGAPKQHEKAIVESTESQVEGKDITDDQKEIDEQKAVEQERMDTFWAVFFLDRVVSSGTGRRSTLRDKDIELSFPALDETDPKSGWPASFPALIRIVHLYGRVADLLNSIKEPTDITLQTPKKLAAMERQVTNFYQGLSPRLHFDAVNFQHYMKAGEGTNFVLLHFWFHTLIVLLHKPTLLKTFEGHMLQLFPNSPQLSMSSAKTIADILSYSQLLDAKASLGNPFTSQPIYIAACAFLRETAEQTASSTAHSRANSPTRKSVSVAGSGGESRPESMSGVPTEGQRTKRMSISELVFSGRSSSSYAPSAGKETASSQIAVDKEALIADKPHSNGDNKKSAHTSAEQQKSTLGKHTLLATAASQHYQLCYKALQSLETYWAGAKYILTILDQMFEGVEDPLLYTIEESESSMERPKPVPEFRSPGWRRKLSWGPYLPGYLPGMVGGSSVGIPNIGGLEIPQSSFWKARGLSLDGMDGDLSKAIGWTLTGTMNSPSTNLAWHYPTTAPDESSGNTDVGHQPQQQSVPQYSPPMGTPQLTGFDTNLHPLGQDSAGQHNMHYQHIRANSSNSLSAPDQLPNVSITSYPGITSGGNTLPNTDAAGLLLGLNSPYSTSSNTGTISYPRSSPGQSHLSINAGQNSNVGTVNTTNYNGQWLSANSAGNNATNNMQPFGDLMIESQDVDMSMLGLDMMPWFDSYPTHDMTDLFNPGSNAGGVGEPTSINGGHEHASSSAAGAGPSGQNQETPGGRQ